MKLRVMENSRALIPQMTIVFSNSSLKILKYYISSEKSQVFFFLRETFCELNFT